MAADIIANRYEAVEQAGARFQKLHDQQVQMESMVWQMYERLRGGAWQGEAATAFFAEMTDNVFPALKRLQNTLIVGSETAKQINQIFRHAEEEAAKQINFGYVEYNNSQRVLNDPSLHIPDLQITEPINDTLRPGIDSKKTSKHQEIIDLALKTSVDNPNEWTAEDYWKLANDDKMREFKLEWIHSYRDTINQAAKHYNIPPELLAGVIFCEVGGDPLWIDDFAYNKRKLFNSLDEARLTSFGNVSIQVRRAIETLGYDPNNIDSIQEKEIIESLKNPRINIYIAAAHIAELKNIDFANVSGNELSSEQIEIIATRFNRGPDLSIDQIRADLGYGKRITEEVGIDLFKETLQ